MKRLNSKGFTLIELLAVIVVLAIVMVIAAPNVITAMNNSKKAAMQTYAKRLVQKANEYVAFQQLQNAAFAGGPVMDTTLGLEENTTYSGCVKITNNGSGSYTYNVWLTAKDKSLCYVNATSASINSGTMPGTTSCNAVAKVSGTTCALAAS